VLFWHPACSKWFGGQQTILLQHLDTDCRHLQISHRRSEKQLRFARILWTSTCPQVVTYTRSRARSWAASLSCGCHQATWLCLKMGHTAIHCHTHEMELSMAINGHFWWGKWWSSQSQILTHHAPGPDLLPSLAATLAKYMTQSVNHPATTSRNQKNIWLKSCCDLLW